MCNVRGQTDAQTSPNKLKREARYLPNRDGKVKVSFEPKYEAAGGAGEEKKVCPNMGEKYLGSEKVPGEGDG